MKVDRFELDSMTWTAGGIACDSAVLGFEAIVQVPAGLVRRSAGGGRRQCP